MGLLAPDSPFFWSFASFIGVELARFTDNLDAVLKLWVSMAATAARIVAREGHAPARLRVYPTRDFLAKAMYRFDGRIAVCPKANQCAKGQFMTYVCDDNGRDKSTYRIYADELDWVLSAVADLEWGSEFSKTIPDLPVKLLALHRRA